VRCVTSRRLARPIDPAPDSSPTPWRVDPARSGGGYFFETASHTLDILDFFFGPIVEDSSFAATRRYLSLRRFRHLLLQVRF
jgi:predicted dehydrogenase